MELAPPINEPLVAVPSGEILANQFVSWHAIRGYDFAGLEAILHDGIYPTVNVGRSLSSELAVPLSVSPSRSFKADRPSDSFYAYTLQDGISVAVSICWPLGEKYGGFSDEIRHAHVISGDKIIGILLPEDHLDHPLARIATVHEARKPLQVQKYIQRTTEHIKELGGYSMKQALK